MSIKFKHGGTVEIKTHTELGEERPIEDMVVDMPPPSDWFTNKYVDLSGEPMDFKKILDDLQDRPFEPPVIYMSHSNWCFHRALLIFDDMIREGYPDRWWRDISTEEDGVGERLNKWITARNKKNKRNRRRLRIRLRKQRRGY